MKATDIGKKTKERFDLSDEIREVLRVALNEIHNTNYSIRFWGLILEPHIRAVIRQKKLLERKKLKITPDLFPAEGTVLSSRKSRLINQLKLFVKHLRSAGNLKEINKRLTEENEIRIGFPEWPGMEKVLPGVKIQEYYPYFFGSGNRKLRQRCLAVADSVVDPYMSNIISSLPEVYVEHFNTILDLVNVKSENKIFHVHKLNNIYNNILIARFIERGALLCWYQHGSHYGEYEWDYLHYFEHMHADQFRTWGWKMRDKDIPWAAYRLEKFRRKYIRYNTTKVTQNLLLIYPRMSSEYKEHNRSATKYILEHLDRDKFPYILARPKPVHRRYSQAGQLSFLNSSRITISNGLAPVEQEVASAELVVQLNVPGTNFLECIYTDHPTVGILRNDHPAEIVKPFYDFLLDKKVLHECIETLILHLNEADLMSWWKGVISEPMYNTFKKTYARELFSENYISHSDAKKQIDE